MLAVLSIAMEGAGFLQLGPQGVFGWLQRDYLLRGIYLSIGPGLFGHVGFNVRRSLSMGPLWSLMDIGCVSAAACGGRSAACVETPCPRHD